MLQYKLLWQQRHRNILMRNALFSAVANHYAGRCLSCRLLFVDSVDHRLKSNLSVTNENETKEESNGEEDIFALLMNDMIQTVQKEEDLAAYIQKEKDRVSKKEDSKDKSAIALTKPKLLAMPHFPIMKTLLLSSLKTGVPIAALGDHSIDANAAHFQPLLEYLVECNTANGHLQQWNEITQRIRNDVQSYHFEV
jgi:hypothetical protein